MVRLPSLNTPLTVLCSALLTLTVPMSVNAATVGKTNIQSMQHEPLFASIEVTDVNPTAFSASVARPVVYERLGLSAEVPVDVRFIKTGENTGRIIITSSKPVDEPFADVVLLLNDDGRTQSVPKTLLLPLGKTTKPVQATVVNIGTTAAPSLPVVSRTVSADTSTREALQILETPTDTANMQAGNVQNVATQDTGTPLTMESTSPPPLMGNEQSPSTASNSLLIDAPLIEPPLSVLTPSNNTTDSSFPYFSAAELLDAQATSPLVSNSIRSEQVANTQQDILNIQTTLKYRALSSDPIGNNGASTGNESTLGASSTFNIKDSIEKNTFNNAANNAPEVTTNSTGLSSAYSMSPVDTMAGNNPVANNTAANTPLSSLMKPKPPQNNQNNNNSLRALQPASTPSISKETTTINKAASTARSNTSAPANRTPTNTPPTRSDIGLSDVTYVVQRNDNLWTIAEQISRANNVSVGEVMNQIQAYNPNAFVHGDKDKLMARTTLRIPAYRVIPSQLGIRAALDARQSQSSTADNNVKTTPPVPTSATTPATNSTEKEQVATNNAPPAIAEEPRLTLVTPTNDESLTGEAAGSGLNPVVLDELQATRRGAAAAAIRAHALAQQVDERRYQLQLHNNKLAQLQQRLQQLQTNK